MSSNTIGFLSLGKEPSLIMAKDDEVRMGVLAVTAQVLDIQVVNDEIYCLFDLGQLYRCKLADFLYQKGQFFLPSAYLVADEITQFQPRRSELLLLSNGSLFSSQLGKLEKRVAMLVPARDKYGYLSEGEFRMLTSDRQVLSLQLPEKIDAISAWIYEVKMQEVYFLLDAQSQLTVVTSNNFETYFLPQQHVKKVFALGDESSRELFFLSEDGLWRFIFGDSVACVHIELDVSAPISDVITSFDETLAVMILTTEETFLLRNLAGILRLQIVPC